MSKVSTECLVTEATVAGSIPAESIVFAVARDVTAPEGTGAQDG